MEKSKLTIAKLIERAETDFKEKQIISRTHHNIRTFTYKAFSERTRSLANILLRLGVFTGDCVGTLAGNHHRHLEIFFAVPMIGAALHPMKNNFSPQQIVSAANFTETRILLIDEEYIPLIEQCTHELKTVEAYIIMTDHNELPKTSLRPVFHYEELLAEKVPKRSYSFAIEEYSVVRIYTTNGTEHAPNEMSHALHEININKNPHAKKSGGQLTGRKTIITVVPFNDLYAWEFLYEIILTGANMILSDADISANRITQSTGQITGLPKHRSEPFTVIDSANIPPVL